MLGHAAGSVIARKAGGGLAIVSTDVREGDGGSGARLLKAAVSASDAAACLWFPFEGAVVDRLSALRGQSANKCVGECCTAGAFERSRSSVRAATALRRRTTSSTEEPGAKGIATTRTRQSYFRTFTLT